MPKRAINIGEARKLSDRALINGLVRDPTSAAIYRRVVVERMQKETPAYSDPYFWTLDGEDPRPRPRSKKLHPLRDFVVTEPGELLDAELADYLERYPFFDDEYDPLERPALCREFCQDKGRRSGDNIYGMTFDDLTSSQKKMLLAIRSHAANWVRRERIARRSKDK